MLLRDDPAVLAVPRRAEPDEGTIDFTPAGAGLYRMISAEWLGPDWEDELRASHGYYWEEHYYAESEAAFDDLYQFGRVRRDAIRSRRVVPIGPWCVSWWERFPSGFRLELECGTDEP